MAEEDTPPQPEELQEGGEAAQAEEPAAEAMASDEAPVEQPEGEQADAQAMEAGEEPPVEQPADGEEPPLADDAEGAGELGAEDGGDMQAEGELLPQDDQGLPPDDTALTPEEQAALMEDPAALPAEESAPVAEYAEEVPQEGAYAEEGALGGDEAAALQYDNYDAAAAEAGGEYDPNAAQVGQDEYAAYGYGDDGAAGGVYDPANAISYDDPSGGYGDPTAAAAAAGAEAYGVEPSMEGPGAVSTRSRAAPGDVGSNSAGGDPSAQARALADAIVAQEREKHEAALKMEARAREELEDMILRIEKHFKAEQAARKKAEELLQASIAAELESKAKMEEVLKKRSSEQRLLEDERAAIKRERAALEAMRQEFEAELQAARNEVAKAQEALAGSEERIRAAEQVERARLEVEYQSKLAATQQEVDRMREELAYRTVMMSEEMEKWRQQAALTANAVLEAKNEVMERKRELDSTKEKMDRLLDKLYIGRERGIELSGAIASNQRMMSFMPGVGMHGPMFLPGGGKGVFMAGQPMQAWGPNPGGPPGSMIPKLPPLKQQSMGYDADAAAAAAAYNAMMANSMANGMGGVPAQQPQGPQRSTSAGVRRVASSNNMNGGEGQQGMYGGGSPGGFPGGNATSRSDGQGGARDDSPGRYNGGPGRQYSDSSPPKPARNAKSGRAGRGGKAAKPDRFEEARKENERIAAMGRRWQ